MAEPLTEARLDALEEMVARQGRALGRLLHYLGTRDSEFSGRRFLFPVDDYTGSWQEFILAALADAPQPGAVPIDERVPESAPGDATKCPECGCWTQRPMHHAAGCSRSLPEAVSDAVHWLETLASICECNPGLGFDPGEEEARRSADALATWATAWRDLLLEGAGWVEALGQFGSERVRECAQRMRAATELGGE